MSNNLLESLKEHFSGDVVANLATLLGESQTNTASALNSALPSLLAGLVGQGADSNSLASLFKLITEGNHDGGVLSNLGALSRGGEETTKLVSQGGILLASLFGDKSEGMADLIANASGIGKSSSNSLLGFITPIVLGMIGKKLKIDNIDSVNGLAGLLSDQSGFIKDVIPAGLSNLLSGGSSAGVATAAAITSPGTATISETVVDIGDDMDDIVVETISSAKHMAENIGESVSEFGSQLVEESKDFAHSAAAAIEDGAGEGSKFLPWILIAAALALAWGLLKSCSAPDPAATNTAKMVTIAPTVTAPTETATAPPPAEPVVSAPPAESAPPEPAKIEAPVAGNNYFEKTLSTGFAIKSAKDGFVSKLLGFIEGDEAINKDLWFTMDGITFDTSKATTKDESSIQINEIAEILKAYPKVKIKIGGYTDNTGKANTNKTLSDNRAKAVKEALVSKTIEGDRIDAEGYGSDHPVASNDTPEGRQQNRRIDVRVTEK